MKKNSKKSLIKILAASSLMFAGCAPTFESETKKILQDEYDMSEPEAAVSVVQAVRDEYGKEVKKDGQVFYTPDYMAISVDAKLRPLLRKRASVENLLESESEEYKDFTRNMNPDMIPALKKQKRILDFRIDRYTYMINYGKFIQLLGGDSFADQLPESLKKMDFSKRKDKNDNLNFDGLEICFPLVRLEDKLPFTANYVQESKKNKWFREEDSFKASSSVLVEKENPDKEADEDTIWVRQNRNIKVICYETDELPEDGVDIDYIEVYVLNKDGKPESKPAIKVFKSSEGALEVLVADRDREGEKGFGLPDHVAELWGVSSNSGAAKNFYDNNIYLINSLFTKKEEKEQKDKEKEKKKPRKMQDPIFLRVGEAKMPEYEICDAEAGWHLPRKLSKYDKKDFALHCKFKEDKKKKYNPHKTKKKNVVHTIEYFAKEYYGKGRVVEFYRVKPEFKDNVLKVSSDFRSDLIKFIIKSKSAQEQGPDFFLEKTPYKIEYDSRDYRHTIADRTKDGKFESKKRYAPVQDLELGEDLE